MKLSKKTRIQLQIQKIIFIVLLLIAVGLLGWLGNKHSVQFDWTSNKRNTLSQSSIELLRTLKAPVTVTVYVQDDETVHAAVKEILQRYQREKKDFTFRLIGGFGILTLFIGVLHQVQGGFTSVLQVNGAFFHQFFEMGFIFTQFILMFGIRQGHCR